MKAIKKLPIVLVMLLMATTFAKAQNLIKATEVTPAYLKIVCAMSDLNVTEVKENYIKVEDVYDIYLDLDSEKKFILFNSEYPLVDGVSSVKALELMNRINKGVIVINAHFDPLKNAIEYRYYFWIKDGFSDESLISAIRMYKDALTYTLEKDTDKIIK